MAEEVGKSRLAEIADELVQATEKLGQRGWTCEDTLQVGSRLLVEAILEGAFGGSEFEPLRLELDDAARHPRDPGDVFITAYEWLTKHGFLPGEVGGVLTALEQMKKGIPELIRGEAAKVEHARRSRHAASTALTEQDPIGTSTPKLHNPHLGRAEIERMGLVFSSS